MFHKHFMPFPPPHPRLFEKGDLKYIILNHVKDKPSHGYEIIRAMEDSFHGFYTPSAGSVYPTLQMLEDMGYVKSSERDGKKVYTITEEGKNFLKERQEVIDKIHGQMKDRWSHSDNKDFLEIVHEGRELGHLIFQGTHRLGPEKWGKIREVISKARKDIENIIENG